MGEKIIFHFFLTGNDPWNPAPQNGSGLGTHPDSAFSPLAVTSKFGANQNQNQNSDPWSLGGAALPLAGIEPSKDLDDPFSPTAQKQLHEFDLLREEIDRQTTTTTSAATGETSVVPDQTLLPYSAPFSSLFL